MSRVLVTGGAGTIGSAVVRRLLSDSQWDVRVADHREAPQWMREGCEIRTADLRIPEAAGAAIHGCSQVIHLAAIVGGIANFHKLPFTLFGVNNALTGALTQAAVGHDVERFVYVSSSMVFERATEFHHRGTRRQLPGAALGLRVLEAGRRDLHPRRERGARPALHDLPPV